MSAAAALAGIVTVLLGLRLRMLRNPTTFSENTAKFIIAHSPEAQGECFRFFSKRDGRLVLTLFGSTELVCDPPVLIQWGHDNNHGKELYFHHCGGHGVVRCDPRHDTLLYTDYGQYDPDDVPQAGSFWVRLIKQGGIWLILKGAGLTLAGIVVFGVLRFLDGFRARHS